MMHVPLMFLSERREFPSAPCLAGKKNLMTARVSMLLKSCASPDMLPFSLCNKKRLVIRQNEQIPLSNDTIDSVLHREVGRAKNVSAPRRNSPYVTNYKISTGDKKSKFPCKSNHDQLSYPSLHVCLPYLTSLVANIV